MKQEEISQGWLSPRLKSSSPFDSQLTCMKMLGPYRVIVSKPSPKAPYLDISALLPGTEGIYRHHTFSLDCEEQT